MTPDIERVGSPADAGRVAELEAEVERLNGLVYVPGLWRCPKCNFNLVQGNLNASDGTVTARNDPGDKCPNCASPLWRVTERQAGNDMVDRAEEQLARALAAEAQAAALREALTDLLDYVGQLEPLVYSPEDKDDHAAVAKARAALASTERGYGK